MYSSIPTYLSAGSYAQGFRKVEMGAVASRDTEGLAFLVKVDREVILNSNQYSTAAVPRGLGSLARVVVAMLYGFFLLSGGLQGKRDR